MMIWAILAVLTGAAIFALLWPLSHGAEPAFADTADAASLYRSQLEEIDRDLGRSLIGPQEAEAARAEAARRLLRSAADQTQPAGETEPSLRRRRASSALMLSVVPLLALVVYGIYGSPNVPDQPLAERLVAAGPQQDFALVFARMEAHLAAHPTDAKGWSLAAPIYMRQGRYEDAERSYAAAIQYGVADADILAGLGESRTLAAAGVVTAAAREAFSKALGNDPANPRARFYLGITKEQDGDQAGAVTALRGLLESAPPGADWAPMVQARIEKLEGGTSRDAIASLPPEQREVAIRGMVDGLAERLKGGGGTLDEWTRLIRARAVLGQTAQAQAGVRDARKRLAGDPPALAAIDALTDELALKEASP